MKKSCYKYDMMNFFERMFEEEFLCVKYDKFLREVSNTTLMKSKLKSYKGLILFPSQNLKIIGLQVFNNLKCFIKKSF